MTITEPFFISISTTQKYFYNSGLLEDHFLKLLVHLRNIFTTLATIVVPLPWLPIERTSTHVATADALHNTKRSQQTLDCRHI